MKPRPDEKNCHKTGKYLIEFRKGGRTAAIRAAARTALIVVLSVFLCVSTADPGAGGFGTLRVLANETEDDSLYSGATAAPEVAESTGEVAAEPAKTPDKADRSAEPSDETPAPDRNAEPSGDTPAPDRSAEPSDETPAPDSSADPTGETRPTAPDNGNVETQAPDATSDPRESSATDDPEAEGSPDGSPDVTADPDATPVPTYNGNVIAFEVGEDGGTKNTSSAGGIMMLIIIGAAFLSVASWIVEKIVKYYKHRDDHYYRE